LATETGNSRQQTIAPSFTVTFIFLLFLDFFVSMVASKRKRLEFQQLRWKPGQQQSGSLPDNE